MGYLPYLVTRSPETESADPVYIEDLDENEAKVSESRLLGPVLFGVGTLAVWWGFNGRPEFGDFGTRYASLITLLSGDRLATSFVVDLVLFALFQGWLVDDDLRRRTGGDIESVGLLRPVAKYVPFVGLCLYMLLRPALPSKPSVSDTGSAVAV